MSFMSQLACGPRRTYYHLQRCLSVGVVPFLRASPGIGKSALAKKLGKEANLKLIDLRLTSMAPEDMTGLVQLVNGYASYAPFREIFPLDDSPLPLDSHGKPMNGWLLFLDEFASAPIEVKAASYRLILDHEVGQHKLHPNVYIVMASNLDSDNAITSPIGTAIESRVVHLEMKAVLEEWLEDVAYVEKYDERIIGFLNYKPEYLMDFDPNHKNKTFCAPRTWEFMNQLVNGQPISRDDRELFCGTITPEVAGEFIAFSANYGKVVTIEQVMAGPQFCAVPDTTDLLWATVTSLAAKTTGPSLAPLCDYVERLPNHFRLLFFRMALIRNPELRATPEFAKSAIRISKYING